MSAASFGQTSAASGGGSGGGLTDAELRATPVPVVDSAGNTLIGAVNETAPATDTASSGTNGRLQRVAQRLTSLIALLPASLGQKAMASSLAVTLASDQSALAVTGPLTDTQLRATAVPVSGTVTTGGLTDTQLRATAVPVSAASLPLPTGAAKDSTLTDSTQRIGGTVAVSAASLPLPTGAATDASLTNGTQVAQLAPDGATTGTITANGQSVTAAVGAGMQGVTLQVQGTYAATVTVNFEASYDGGTTYLAMAAVQVPTPTTGVAAVALSANLTMAWSAPLPAGATHVRMRCSGFGASGTVNVRIAQSSAVRTVTPTFANVGVTSVTTGVAAASLGKAEDAAAVTGDTGVAVLGVRNDTQATSTNADGDYIQQSHDARGAIRTNPASFTYSHITTATTTTVKAGAGEVHTITVNSLGTVASTVTVYDNTAGSGTVIAVINSLSVLGTLTFDVAFATGLTLVTTGTVAPDITVSYR